ncbi:Response regulator PleD [Fundidesulfovibrio magnetotacticus]|uniref:diguanylate cyclase n=1 Tax=Fundidesulfovibrio magnetotacticus TaxID=2730080 RepID=A0A6V8LXH3_9BACT|nr:diguanylate cyclase [Fundidesulfovibrio magnetotacticus]GFK95281.1 Response regulator PleD [Fundidesulfovibrio magnetotacticus]
MTRRAPHQPAPVRPGPSHREASGPRWLPRTWRRALLLALAMLLAGHGPAPAAETLRVAVLLSSGQTLPWSRELLAGLAEAQNRHGAGLELSIEPLDAARFSTPAQEKTLRDLLAARHAPAPPHAIVAESDNALRFLERHGRDIFGDAPVVLLASRGQGSGLPNFRSAIDDAPWIQATARLILAVAPRTGRVLVLGDDQGRGRAALDLAQEALTARKPRLEVEVAAGLSESEMAGRVAGLAPHSAVLYALPPSDGPGDALERVAAASSAPVFAFSETFLGRGIAGGYLVSPRMMASLAVDEALSAARGAPPALPSVPDPPTFDRRALDRWGIPASALPAGSRILFDEPPLHRRYPGETAIVAAVVALETALIAALCLLLARRGREAARLARAHALLEERVGERAGELARLAVTDGLTGLPNRREFTRLAAREVERARRSGRDFSLVMADLDNFMEVNGLSGHDAGDAVLQAFAALLAANLRKADVVARYEGDAFVALLPDTAPESALVAVEKLRLLVEGTAFDAGSAPPLRITVSFGVAGSAETASDLDSLLQLAVHRLSEAKRAGRNRVCGPPVHEA